MILTIRTIVLSVTLSTAVLPTLAQEGSKQIASSDRSATQNIQDSDYRTIAFIEDLYASLSKLSQDSSNCSVQVTEIIFVSPRDTENRFILKLSTPEGVSLDGKLIVGQKPIEFFRALHNALSDSSRSHTIEIVRYAQFPTRAYKKRTIIEFKLADRVVTIDAFSNGPKDEERWYILAIEPLSESFFWSRPK